MKKRLLTYLFLLSLLAAIFCVAAGFKIAMRPRTYTYYAEYTAEDVFMAVNRQRTAAGLSPFTRDLKLIAAAEAKAQDMKDKKYFSHNTPDGKTPWLFIQAAGYNYQTAGENLAINFDTADGVVAGWMQSPGHRANILNPNFTEMGIAVLKIDTGYLVTQEFGHILPDEFSEKYGKASYYDYVLKDGWSSKGHLVCAARDWPRKSKIEVTNTITGKSVVCTVTDYGPDFSVHPDRIVDLSSFSFSQIADLKSGVVPVSVKLVK